MKLVCMKLVCQCCSRELTVFKNDPSHLTGLTKDLINDSLEIYSGDDGLDSIDDDDVIRQNLYYGTPYNEDDEIGPTIDNKETTVFCSCGAAYRLGFHVSLKTVKLPLSHAKSWLSSDVKDELGIESEYDLWNQPAPANKLTPPTHYHGASVPGCVHNHVFVRNCGNSSLVRCTKCGHERYV